MNQYLSRRKRIGLTGLQDGQDHVKEKKKKNPNKTEEMVTEKENGMNIQKRTKEGRVSKIAWKENHICKMEFIGSHARA